LIFRVIDPLAQSNFSSFNSDPIGFDNKSNARNPIHSRRNDRSFLQLIDADPGAR